MLPREILQLEMARSSSFRCLSLSLANLGWLGSAESTCGRPSRTCLSRCAMRCSLRIKRSAAKALAALPKADRVRLVEAINLLCDTPAAGSALKGEFEGLRRLRVGNYRVVYEWQRSELVILVVRIGHRREVYR